MAFHVIIKGGDEDGRSFAVETPCVVGRAPSCQVRLASPKVSWEHLTLRDADGRLFAQGLSAEAVKVGGKKIRGEQRVVHGDLIELPGDVALLVEERVGAGNNKGQGVNIPLVLVAAALLMAGAFTVYQTIKPKPAVFRPFTAAHWRTAHELLAERIDVWVERGDFPEEAGTLFRDGWRMNLASNPTAALENWDKLRTALMTLRVPGENADLDGSIVEEAGLSPLTLRVVSGYELSKSIQSDPTWASDANFASALSWFVKGQADWSRSKVNQ